MTEHITPQEAQQLRDGATEGPWEVHDEIPTAVVNPEIKFAILAALDEKSPDPENTRLAAAAPRLAATIAADTIEYAYIYRDEGSDTWNMTVGGFKSREGAEAERRSWLGQVPDESVKLVARRVSPTWEVEE